MVFQKNILENNPNDSMRSMDAGGWHFEVKQLSVIILLSGLTNLSSYILLNAHIFQDHACPLVVKLVIYVYTM